MTTTSMKFKVFPKLVIAAALITGIVSCKDGNSIYDPNYEPPRPDPVISSISPADGYLAGVDSVIVTGENFASSSDSVIINFGGSPGVIKSATETQLIVRPGTKWGEDLGVRVGVRGAEFFSNTFPYDLFQPFGFYAGVDGSNEPTSPVAVDDANNIYTIVNTNGIIRYTRISPDGSITEDMTRYPGEQRPEGGQYPTDSTMRFTSYSALAIGPGGDLFLGQQSLRAIFLKTFGDDSRESVWAASSNGNLQIRDFVFDNNGYFWVVGFGSNQIHRFNASNKNEVQTPFSGDLSSVAFYSNTNELFVGGRIDGSQKIWKFTIDGSGNLTQGGLYFDLAQHYAGTVSDMILASNGELLIALGPRDNTTKPSMVRVFPDGTHEVLYEGMLKPGAASITWRDDNIAVVTVRGEENSINFLDMYDRTRAGIFGF